MYKVQISGTGLYTPKEKISNEELVQSFNKYVDEFNEINSPQLIRNEELINPSIKASNNVEKDIVTLINFSQYCQNLKVQSNWQKTLPIYPTSPIDSRK